MRLKELAAAVSCEYRGDGEIEICRVSTLLNASSGSICFLDNSRYESQLAQTQASVVILNPALAGRAPCAVLLTKEPYVIYAKVAALFERRIVPPVGIHSSAVIAKSADIAASAAIGPQVVIGERVKIGARVVIEAGVVIGEEVVIDDDSCLYANVTLYARVKIGKRCVIHSGAVIGSDGFGYARSNTGWQKVPQLGSVVIEDQVEIGANTTIDRGAIEDTVIHRGVIIDNQVQIAHNVRIGELTAIAGCVGVAGSTTIGKRCLIGGGSGIGGHLTIADDVVLTGMAMVTHSITKPGVYSSGTGILPNAEWRRAAVRFRQLEKILKGKGD